MILVTFVCICELMRAAVESLRHKLEALSVLALSDASTSFRTTSQATEQYLFAYFRLTRAIDAVCGDWQWPIFVLLLLTMAVFVGFVLDVLVNFQTIDPATQVLRQDPHPTIECLFCLVFFFFSGDVDLCVCHHPRCTSAACRLHLPLV